MADVPLEATVDPDRLAPETTDPAVAVVMRDEVDFCLPSTPIDAVAKLMGDNTLSEIVVLLDRRPVGYVRQEDILDRLVAGDVVISGSDFAMRPPTTDVLARDVLRARPDAGRRRDATGTARRRGREGGERRGSHTPRRQRRGDRHRADRRIVFTSEPAGGHRQHPAGARRHRQERGRQGADETAP